MAQRYIPVTEKEAKKQKEGGNIGLPFGLCEKYGIILPENATPTQAWDALKEKTGLSPDSFYKKLNKEEPEKQNNQAQNKMTPAEKIASVHIDFDRDNILPELNEAILNKLGTTQNKKVLLKGATIKRNLGKHIDVTQDIMQDIIMQALYDPIDVFPANPNNANYYHMASFVEVPDKNGLKMGLVLLDIDKSKEHFEVGHAYFVDGKGFEKAKMKTSKKD